MSQCGGRALGASMIAYVLLVALISIAGIVGIKATGKKVKDNFLKTKYAIASGNFCDPQDANSSCYERTNGGLE